MEQGMLSIAIHTAEAGLITRCISCAVGLWVTADLGNVDAYLRVIGKEDWIESEVKVEVEVEMVAMTPMH
jgi:hypothetical protein